MNLLAHAVLSPPDEMIRLGNVLADFVGRNEKPLLEPQIQVGMELHRRIDAFTDSHPIVERSKAKLIAFQRFGNPLIDVFYDHFLTKHWTQEQSVFEFTRELYNSIECNQILFPDNCRRIAGLMIEHDWMNHYGSFEGLAITLDRMSKRIEWATGRTVDLASSIQILEVRYDEFEQEFLEFWPELELHTQV